MQIDEYIIIMDFNYVPLSSLLIQALIDRPELIPQDTLVRWTAEQEIIMEKTIREMRTQGV